MKLIEDPQFKVVTLQAYEKPQLTAWLAMHEDVTEDPVSLHPDKWPSEAKAGESVVRNCLKFGHHGVSEHPQITFEVIGYPHSSMQQLRTHRVGLSFDVTSGRFTGNRYIDVANDSRDIEDVFYFRPVGEYSDRATGAYIYTESMRMADMSACYDACKRFKYKVEILNFSNEHARDLMPFNFRQDFVLSANLRSLMHLLMVRGLGDSQLELQTMMHMMLEQFKMWAPEVAAWFEQSIWQKNKLAP